MNAMSEPIFKLPEFTIHDRLGVLEADLRPWSIDGLGVRKLGRERGKGIRVGIIDTGIDGVHLKSGDLAHCVKDCRDFTNSRFGHFDQHGHGSHTAGTVAGIERENGGVGTANAAELFIGKALGDNGSGTDGQVVECIYWHIDNKVHIINMSLGSPVESKAILRAVDDAVAAGITVVAAAGNFGDNARSWPAMHPNCISVAAIDEDKRPASFSEPSSVDVAAPGVKILSCYKNGGYGLLSGTSMAAPWLSGFLAAWFSDLLRAGVKLPTPGDVFDMIDDWTLDIGAPGRDAKTGNGLVSAEKYLAAMPKPAPKVPLPTRALVAEFPLRFELWRRNA